jgi:decaprenylphospho-beta-D-erythro-pentofuranosid-2-ulose 2-reductase
VSASGTGPALIVGAASDIGRAIALAYAEAGRPLILAARRPERLERDAEDIRIRHRVPVQVAGFDILDAASHAPLLDGLPELPGTVISVVGLLGKQPFSAADPKAAETVMRTNYLAPALFLGEVANRMERRGGGTIIGISSVAGDRGRGSNYIYGSAKAGFTAFLSGLRNRLAASGVHVVTVKPGFVDTKVTEGMKLPPLLTAQPGEVGRAVLAAERKRRDAIYVRPLWMPVMTVIRLIPERVFKKLRL